MKTDDVSLRLLRIVDGIHRTRSVSRAAEELNMSQPAISVGLAKLRAHFNDAIFVRTTAGMVPTPNAASLLAAARDSLNLLDAAFSSHATFVPAETQRHFAIGMNMLTQMVVFPRMVRRIQREASNCLVQALPINAESLRGLDTGTMDLAVGNIPDIGPGYFKRTLFHRDFVCVAAFNHPRIQSRITQEQFLAERHAVIKCAGSGMGTAEAWIEKRKIQRHVAVRASDFMGIESVVAGSQLIATVPRPVGALYASLKKVRVLEHPFPLPKFAVKLHWHERSHKDPGHQWLRELIGDVMLNHGTKV